MIVFSFACVVVSCFIALPAFVLPAVSAAQSGDALFREDRQIISDHLPNPQPGLRIVAYYFFDPSPSRKAIVTCILNDTCGEEKRVRYFILEPVAVPMTLGEWSRLKWTLSHGMTIAKNAEIRTYFYPFPKKQLVFIDDRGEVFFSDIPEDEVSIEDFQDEVDGGLHHTATVPKIVGCLDAVAEDSREEAPERLEKPLMGMVIMCYLLHNRDFYAAYAGAVWDLYIQVLYAQGRSPMELGLAQKRWIDMVEEGFEWKVVE